mgnify:FL=1
MYRKKESLPYLAQRLKTLRHASGFTQQRLADLLHIERCTYAFYESGKSHPDLGLILRIARIYNTTVDHLVDPDYDLFTSTAMTVHAPPIPAGLQSPIETSKLEQDEQSFLVLYRQLNRDKKEKLLTYMWELQQESQDEATD